MALASVAAYLRRVGLDPAAPPPPTRAGLVAVHRAHLARIPYENLDVALGLEPSMDEQAIVEKVVGRGRGGWCYELNGTLGWALDRLGFRVRRVAGAVNRHEGGDGADGNHLVLLVDLPEGTLLADAGLGEGPFDPLPLAVGTHLSAGRAFTIEHAGGRWLVRLPDGAGATEVDFTEAPTTLGELVPVARRLATDPASPFVRNVVLCRVDDGLVLKLAGRRLWTTTPTHADARELDGEAAWIACVRERFLLGPAAIGDGELQAIWERLAPGVSAGSS